MTNSGSITVKTGEAIHCEYQDGAMTLEHAGILATVKWLGTRYELVFMRLADRRVLHTGWFDGTIGHAPLEELLVATIKMLVAEEENAFLRQLISDLKEESTAYRRGQEDGREEISSWFPLPLNSTTYRSSIMYRYPE